MTILLPEAVFKQNFRLPVVITNLIPQLLHAALVKGDGIFVPGDLIVQFVIAQLGLGVISF